MKEQQRRDAFIRELAEYLVGQQAHMSILLQMGNGEGKQWSRLRSLTYVHGWPTVDEAERELRRFLLAETEVR